MKLTDREVNDKGFRISEKLPINGVRRISDGDHPDNEKIKKYVGKYFMFPIQGEWGVECES